MKKKLGLFLALITMGSISNELFSMQASPPPPPPPPPPPFPGVFPSSQMRYSATVSAVKKANAESDRKAFLQEIQNPQLKPVPPSSQKTESGKDAVTQEVKARTKRAEANIPSPEAQKEIDRIEAQKKQRAETGGESDLAREIQRKKLYDQEKERLNPGYTEKLRQYEETTEQNRARFQKWEKEGGKGIPPAPIYVERPVAAPSTNTTAKSKKTQQTPIQFKVTQKELENRMQALKKTNRREDLVPSVVVPQAEPSTPQAQAAVGEGLTPRERARLRRQQQREAADATATPQPPATPQPTGLSAVAPGGLNADQLAGEPRRTQKGEDEEEEEEDRE